MAKVFHCEQCGMDVDSNQTPCGSYKLQFRRNGVSRSLIVDPSQKVSSIEAIVGEVSPMTASGCKSLGLARNVLDNIK